PINRFFLTLASLPLILAFGFLLWLATTLDQVRDAFSALISVFIPIPDELLLPVAAGLILSTTILYFTLMELGYRSFSVLFAPRRRARVRWRKKLAALLAQLHHMGPGGLAALLENDRQLALHLQRFLAHHQVPFSLPFYDSEGRYLFASPGKIEVLA